MLASAISKSSNKKKVDPKPVDSTKNLINKQLNPLATVMGKIEDIVSTGDEETDSTPLKDEEIEELRRLVTRFERKFEDLRKQVSWKYTQLVIERPPPPEYKYHVYGQQP